ncbi:20065_t:CDS:1, partial [Dentiscutata erythropus]
MLHLRYLLNNSLLSISASESRNIRARAYPIIVGNARMTRYALNPVLSPGLDYSTGTFHSSPVHWNTG